MMTKQSTIVEQREAYALRIMEQDKQIAAMRGALQSIVKECGPHANLSELRRETTGTTERIALISLLALGEV